MRSSTRRISYFRLALSGGLLGVVLSRLGFSSYGEIHRMFTFADPRLFFAYGGAIAILGAALSSARARNLPHRPIHRGTVTGGFLFGAGWALTGACPAVLLVQLGEGQLLGGLTLLGVVGGLLFCRKVLAPTGKFGGGGSCS